MTVPRTRSFARAVPTHCLRIFGHVLSASPRSGVRLSSKLGLLPPPCGGGLGRAGGGWGGGGGGGGGGWLLLRELCPPTATPTPNPSPQGGGEHTEWVRDEHVD